MANKPIEIYYLPKGEHWTRLIGYNIKRSLQCEDGVLKEDTIPMYQDITRHFDKEARKYFYAEDFDGVINVTRDIEVPQLIVDDRIIVEVLGHKLSPKFNMGMEIKEYVKMTLSPNFREGKYIGKLHFDKRATNVFIQIEE